MRDPNRIPEVLAKIQEVWLKYPDLRLGQLIENAADWSGRSGVSIWMLEEPELVKGLERLLGETENI